MQVKTFRKPVGSSVDRSKSDSPEITVVIPGRQRSIRIKHVVVDFNGTLAVDGRLIRGVATRLKKLALKTNVIVMTADTFGSVHETLSGLPVKIRIVRRGSDKRRFVESLSPRNVACIGNGVNDLPMFRAATIITQDINAALDLLLNPQRLIATLRL